MNKTNYNSLDDKIEDIKEKFSTPEVSPEAKEIKNTLRILDADHKISDVIRKRIEDFNDENKENEEEIAETATYRCNDDISRFIKEGEIDALVDEVAGQFQGVLQSLIIDTENDWNTKDTAHRVAKMFVTETMAGRFNPTPSVTAFPNDGYSGLYTVGPIKIRSLCAHHFQNITGNAWVGVVPGKKVIGLSKFNRIINDIAARPQIQEEMTRQIGDALVRITETEDIAVIVKAEHHCMISRGVKEHESEMISTDLRGTFRVNDPLRAEFYSLIQNLKSF